MQQGVRTLAIAAVFALFPVVAMSAAADRSARRWAPASPHGQLQPAAVLPLSQNGAQ